MTEIKTERLQLATARWLHRQSGHLHDLDECDRPQQFRTKAAWLIGHQMLALVTEVRPQWLAAERVRLAEKVEAELVCCDIFEQLEKIAKDLAPSVLASTTPWGLAWQRGLDFHEICYYGAWAASLVKDEGTSAGEEDGTMGPVGPEPAQHVGVEDGGDPAPAQR